jgi:hypothetical protein
MTPVSLSLILNMMIFIKVFNLVLLHISKWFQTNQSILNVEKVPLVTPNKFSHYPPNFIYADQALTEYNNLNFLGLHL